MKKLKIDLGELLLALDSSAGEAEYFLDRTTGEILMRFKDAPDAEEIDARLAAGSDERYEAIEPVPSRERFEVMADFAESLPDSATKERLFHALQQRRPFRGFKAALLYDEALRQSWFDFERASAAAAAERWLTSLGLEFEWVGPVADSPPR
jgi:hypothetical protein